MRVFWKFLQLYLLLFLVCLTESLYAAPRYYFKQISLENGLSQSSVKCVLVDERGVMWIGTRFGLNRFDREKITVYQEERENPNSLPYNDIVFLEEDAEGIFPFGINGTRSISPVSSEYHQSPFSRKDSMTFLSFSSYK